MHYKSPATFPVTHKEILLFSDSPCVHNCYSSNQTWHHIKIKKFCEVDFFLVCMEKNIYSCLLWFAYEWDPYALSFEILVISEWHSLWSIRRIRRWGLVGVNLAFLEKKMYHWGMRFEVWKAHSRPSTSCSRSLWLWIRM